MPDDSYRRRFRTVLLFWEEEQSTYEKTITTWTKPTAATGIPNKNNQSKKGKQPCFQKIIVTLMRILLKLSHKNSVYIVFTSIKNNAFFTQSLPSQQKNPPVTNYGGSTKEC